MSARYSVHSLLLSFNYTSCSVPGATSPIKSKRSGVHPSTDFDQWSHSSTPMPSDTEAEGCDLHCAQRMEMIFSTITFTLEVQCVIKTILCREYKLIVKEAEEGNKRLRKYLVATDLSEEAQHALELTITVEKQNCPHNQKNHQSHIREVILSCARHSKISQL